MSSSSYVIGAVIGGGLTLTGSLVGAALQMVRDSRARREDRHAAHVGRVGDAVHEYLAALDAIAAEMSGLPKQPKLNRAERWPEKRAEGTGIDVIGHSLARVMARAAYGSRSGTIDELLSEVSARVREEKNAKAVVIGTVTVSQLGLAGLVASGAPRSIRQAQALAAETGPHGEGDLGRLIDSLGGAWPVSES